MTAWILIAAMMGAGGANVDATRQAQPPSAAKERPATRRVIVDSSLRRHVGELSAIGPKEILYFDEGRRPRTIARDEVLVILPKAKPTIEGETGSLASGDPEFDLVELVSGERIPGKWGAWRQASESVSWKSPLLGDLMLKLDEIHRIRQAGQRPTAPAGADASKQDTVTLTNGDVLSGFVDSIGERVQVAVQGKHREIDRGLVAEIVLAGQGVQAGADKGKANASGKSLKQTVWLTDGSSIDAEKVESVGSTLAALAITRRGQTIEVPLALLDTWSPNRARVAGLAGLVPTKQAPFGDRAWAAHVETGDRSVPLGAADVLLPGPMVVEWAMPAGATRLALEAELPAACRVWGDCVLIVETVGKATTEIARERLNDARPMVTINVALSQASKERTTVVLRITLDPGERGPIQDRVLLRQPILLLGGEK